MQGKSHLQVPGGLHPGFRSGLVLPGMGLCLRLWGCGVLVPHSQQVEKCSWVVSGVPGGVTYPDPDELLLKI